MREKTIEKNVTAKAKAVTTEETITETTEVRNAMATDLREEITMLRTENLSREEKLRMLLLLNQ
mgnify:CR=1 FL=1